MARKRKTDTQEVQIHVVEYVNSTAGETKDFGTVVIATIRPDQGSWRPHNLGLRAEQADKLRRDLNRLFERSKTLAAWKEQNPKQTEDEYCDQ